MSSFKDYLMEGKCLIFYDGICKLCNWWVWFLIRRDTSDHFVFFPVQKISGKELSEKVLPASRKTVVVYCQGKWFYKSSALIEIVRLIPGPWNLLRACGFLPSVIRDGLYSLIARYRFRVFGKYDNCQVIPQEFMIKFPDPESVHEYLE